MKLRRDWTVILCRPRDWRLWPVWSRRATQWPRHTQFHWLFLYFHIVEEIAE